MHFGGGELFLLPHVIEKALDAAVVEARCRAPVARRAARIDAAGAALRRAMFRQGIERVRPVVPVDEIEVRIARMVRDRAPGLRVLHAVDDRAVAARGLAEAAAMLAAGERAELAIDERHQLARQVVGVIADRGRIDVLVAAQRGKAVRKDEDRGSHPALVDQARRALGQVVAERLPVGVRDAGAGEADEVEQHRETPAAAARGALVVLRRQPHAELAHVRIAERVVLQNLRDVLQHDERARCRLAALQGHGVLPDCEGGNGIRRSRC